MPRRKVKTEERNDDPTENLVNDLKNAKPQLHEYVRNDDKEPKDEPKDNVDKQRVELVRLSEDGEIDQSVKNLKAGLR